MTKLLIDKTWVSPTHQLEQYFLYILNRAEILMKNLEIINNYKTLEKLLYK